MVIEKESESKTRKKGHHYDSSTDYRAEKGCQRAWTMDEGRRQRLQSVETKGGKDGFYRRATARGGE